MTHEIHHLILVPGLSGEINWLKMSIAKWQGHGFTTHIHDMHWFDASNSLDAKMKELLHRIDYLSKNEARVSLLGISAGGSAVLNAYLERTQTVHRIINICGRLRQGVNATPSLEWAARLSPAFKASVLEFEKREPKMTDKERSHVMTVRGFWDEIVPLSTIPLERACNIRVLAIEHNLTSMAAITVYSQRLVKFLKE